ncbi:MAG: family N-acetyltransferase [Microbacteriaceae bacterium]|nr:family N-acetyltransferase [Microbacteriaceae bacterium]
MTSEFRTAPIDKTSAERLAAVGLRLGLVDTEDRAGFEAWLQADFRGFHSAPLTEELLPANLEGLAYRRTTGVWDERALHAASPVATTNSWVGELTVPGERTVPAWAISSVTVAPTHRRKGIARNLLEAELRTAAGLGMPLAMLTVSESTIYGRFGFAPAAMAAEWRIDVRRAKWTGPQAPGALHFVTIEQFREQAADLFDTVRLTSPGEIDMWGLRWDELTGIQGRDKERAKNLRAVRYDDAAGRPQGYALYQVTGGEQDFSAHTLSVEYLLTATPDAYAGLWRFLLEVDLVTEVKAWLRSADEPLRWQLSDFRAARVSTSDHLWLRILDVKAALEARAYAAPGRFVLEISDDLDFTTGRWLVEIADGAATVSPADDAPTDDAPILALSANELAALYLGGVSATTLVGAGRIAELQPGAAQALDTSFRSPRTPWLSFWF